MPVSNTVKRADTADAGVTDLTPGVNQSRGKVVNLLELGFQPQISQSARDEIARSEARENMVLTTATRFAFR